MGFSFRRWPSLLAFLALGAATQASAQVPVPEMVAIPQGDFLMGSDQGATWEQPVHQVTVSGFLIGARPVTNGQFRAFRPSYKNPANDGDGAPVRGVSWEDAGAYCDWLRDKTGEPYRLPTEAEWERAIRGGLQQKKYPWGDDPAVPEEAVATRSAWPPPPPNPYGLFIEHELWEWAADIYSRNYYQESPPMDPKGPEQGEFRVLRGGSYPNDPNSMRCSNRGSARPKTVLPNVTFRVARDAVPGEISQLRQPAAPPTVSETRPAQTQPAPAPSSVASAATLPAATPVQPAGASPETATAPPAPADSPAPTPPVHSATTQPPAQTTSPAPRQAPPPAQPQAPAQRAAQTIVGGPAELTRVDVTVSSEQIILALSLTGTVEYSTMELESPGRIVLDLKNAEVATTRKYGSIPVSDLGVEKIRWAPFEASVPTARLVVDLLAPVAFSIEAAPSGLVVKLHPR